MICRCRISLICQRFKKRYKNIHHKPISEMDHVNIHVGHNICTKVTYVENSNNFSAPNPFKYISDLLLIIQPSTLMGPSRHCCTTLGPQQEGKRSIHHWFHPLLSYEGRNCAFPLAWNPGWPITQTQCLNDIQSRTKCIMGRFVWLVTTRTVLYTHSVMDSMPSPLL